MCHFKLIEKSIKRKYNNDKYNNDKYNNDMYNNDKYNNDKDKTLNVKHNSCNILSLVDRAPSW